MLFLNRRVGLLDSGRRETAIVNERWEISVEQVYVDDNPPRLRLRALKHESPYLFAIKVHDHRTNSSHVYERYIRYPDDVDDESNLIVLKHNGHKLIVFVNRIRGNHVKLGFDGKDSVFYVRRNEKAPLPPTKGTSPNGRER